MLYSSERRQCMWVHRCICEGAGVYASECMRAHYEYAAHEWILHGHVMNMPCAGVCVYSDVSVSVCACVCALWICCVRTSMPAYTICPIEYTLRLLRTCDTPCVWICINDRNCERERRLLNNVKTENAIH